jgi:hypothetical protein
MVLRLVLVRCAVVNLYTVAERVVVGRAAWRRQRRMKRCNRRRTYTEMNCKVDMTNGATTDDKRCSRDT